MIRSMHRRVARAAAGGATLVELIVALVMLAAGILPLLLAMNKIFVGTVALDTRSQAQLLAAERVDQLKSVGFATLELTYLAGTESVVINDGAIPSTRFQRVNQLVYQVPTATSLVDATPAQSPTSYIKITSTVNWTIEGSPVTRSVTTLVTREGAFE